MFKLAAFYYISGLYYCVHLHLSDLIVAGYRKPCQEKYWEAVRNRQPSAYTPRCRPDGDYEAMQCDRQDCWCVEPQGAEINGTRTRGTITCPPCEFGNFESLRPVNFFFKFGSLIPWSLFSAIVGRMLLLALWLVQFN